MKQLVEIQKVDEVSRIKMPDGDWSNNSHRQVKKSRFLPKKEAKVETTPDALENCGLSNHLDRLERDILTP
jgi:hypothetical protein